MKTKSSLLFLITVILLNPYSYAQNPPTFYPSDTIWKRTVHRIIDLDFPRNRIMSDSAALSSGYNGLMSIILNGLEEYGVDVYEKIEGGEFVHILKLAKVYENLGSSIDTFYVENWDTGEQVMKIEKNPVNLNSVKRFEIVQEYFFIKSSSQFSSNIIAIRPIRVYTKDIDVYNDEESAEEDISDEDETLFYADVGWFRFDQLRSILAKEQIKNPANENAFSNYLSIFESGDYDSYIIKINNNFGKGIADYTDANENPNSPTIEMMLESHRIEYELFNFEMSLWEY